ncbi:MAG: SDR family oxidoreductase [Eubacterium sp.]|nr:SDR family oxidoreductase [Eubacterium sp.]
MEDQRKTVFITGGSGGIGAALTEVFSDEGWDVCFTYLDSAEKAQELAAKTGALAIRCDVRDPIAVAEAVRQGRTWFGVRAFDACVCAAGVAHLGLLSDMAGEDVDRVIDINLKGAIHAAREVSLRMREEGRGSIVLISSIWGSRPASGEAVYAASKAGIEGFARSLAAELGPSGVRVNALAPGVIDTRMNASLGEEALADLAGRTALGRIGTPEEAARAALFLAGEGSRGISGQIIGADGGFSL